MGPYDELIIGPGKYEYKKPVTGGALGEDGRPSTSKEKNMMITRIYVSSKESTFNGRYSRSIPDFSAKSSQVTISSPTNLHAIIILQLLTETFLIKIGMSPNTSHASSSLIPPMAQ